jgi:CHAT domain-containing protein
MNARIASLDARILRAASVAPKERDGDAEARLRQDLDVARKALLDLDERIGREWPRYLDLTAPRPLPLADAQSLLSPDEALVSWLVTGDGTFLWAVRRDAALFERLDVSRKELTEAVRRLRRGLDLGAAGPRILERPFDVASAHELYLRLLGPAERLLSGARHLLVVPDGALTSLPLAVLVTSPPAGEIREIRDHANVDWLVRRHAITTLPSVGSLRSLRAFAKGAPAPDPFSGFGDPILQGGPGSRGADSDALLSRGLVADTREVRKLSRLPETAHELQTIASLLGSPPDRVHLAEDATETRVKELDLARYRVLAFATHGLMAGDFRGLAEPALVLTPPEEGTEQDDGLLTASEVARLKLNADWVILSACNTAAPDGTPGAEGLSGLAKAFFFAGTRSLLVSHWAVNSEATVSLTTGAFQALGGGAPRAEALRRSMLALMQSTIAPEFAHPALWAPFVVVGEGWDAPAPSAHSMRRGQDGTARP